MCWKALFLLCLHCYLHVHGVSVCMSTIFNSHTHTHPYIHYLHVAIAVLFTWQCLWCRDPVCKEILQCENVHSLFCCCCWHCMDFWLSCCFPLQCFSLSFAIQFDTMKHLPEQSRTNTYSFVLFLYLYLSLTNFFYYIIYFFSV